MADHELQVIADAVLTELASALTSYTGISLTKGLFKPGWLPTFTSYAVRVTPASTPWREVPIGVRTFQYQYRFELFLLCKVTDEDLSLWGDSSDTPKGVFQLVQDVKDALRGNSLSGLLDKSYEEVLGDVTIDQAATAGFETAERVLVQRARMPYAPKTRPFCVPV